MSPSLQPSFSPTSYWSKSTLNWEQHGLAVIGNTSDDQLGTSVAIDSNTLVVGAPGVSDNDDRPGYVQVYYKQFDFVVHQWMWDLVETFTGNTNGDLFGEFVTISEDGKTLAIGAPGYYEKKDRPGYTRVYTRDDKDAGSTWTKLGEDIKGAEKGDQSGHSVSLSADGKTIAIGGTCNNDNGRYAGHVRVYTVFESDGSSAASWQQIGQDIDGEAISDQSGYSVSLSADGMTIAIGAIRNDGVWEDSGHVRIYNLVGDEWEQIGQDIDGENKWDRFGSSVSMSSDGRIVAIGAPFNDDNGSSSGKVKVYRLDSTEGKWVQVGQDINGEARDWSGRSVSLSSGKTLAIGADRNGANGGSSGHVRVYSLIGSDDDSLSWIQVGKDIYGVEATDSAGWSVSLSSDGKVVAIGS